MNPERHARHREATLVLRRTDGRWSARGDVACRVGDEPGAGDPEIFVEWRWDGESLHVANDRFGLWPAYSCIERDRIILSTTLSGVLSSGASAAPDDAALAVLLRLGYFVGDDTPFRSIRRWPPGARLDLDGRIPRLLGGPTLARPNPDGRKRALDRYGELMRLAVAADLPDTPFVHPLSGGRDSRHLLFALDDAGSRPSVAITLHHLPPKPDEDARIAALLTDRLGVAHRTIHQAVPFVDAQLRKNRRTEFATPGTHEWLMPLVDQLAGYDGVLFDGYGGDVLSMARYLDPAELELYRDGRLTDLAHRMLVDRVTGRLYTGSARDRWSPSVAAARLERELRLHVGAPNPVRSFRFWNYGRRQIAAAPFGLLRDVRVRAPFLSTQLYDYLAGLAPEVILEDGGHFHTEAIRRAYPGLADLPFERENLPPRHDAHWYRLAAAGTLRWLLSRPAASELQRSYIIPRLARCLAGGRYGQSVRWLGAASIYATQLEECVRQEKSETVTSG